MMDFGVVFSKIKRIGVLGAVLMATAGVTGAEVLIDHTCTNIDTIPSAWVEKAKTDLHVVYQHTSHGSQLTSGMRALENHPVLGNTFKWDDGGNPAEGLDLDDYGIPGCADLSQGDSIDANGVTPWVTATRNLLDNSANNHVNVVIWSWCSINGHNAQRYVDNMEILISEYGPGGSSPRAAAYPVTFVFMTGHAQGQGEYSEVNNVHYNNELIRDHCRTHNRVLFDFADIEAYDPDGAYFWDLDMTDNLNYTGGGNWAVEWLAANPGSELDELTTGSGISGYDGCTSCAHSDSPRQATLNCVLKGRAAWWMMARLAGWDAGQSSNRAPLLGAIGDKSIVAGNELLFTVNATDPDGDTLQYAAADLPSGASFDAAARTFRWTPDAGDIGQTDVRFTVTDNGSPSLSDTETITITVLDAGSGNYAPQITPVTDPSVTVGEAVTITFQVNDPDGDSVVCHVAQIPDGAAFDDAAMIFTWTPQEGDSGVYDIVFTATDDGIPPQTSTHTVTITVTDGSTDPDPDSGGDSDGSGCFIDSLAR